MTEEKFSEILHLRLKIQGVKADLNAINKLRSGCGLTAEIMANNKNSMSKTTYRFNNGKAIRDILIAEAERLHNELIDLKKEFAKY